MLIINTQSFFSVTVQEDLFPCGQVFCTPTPGMPLRTRTPRDLGLGWRPVTLGTSCTVVFWSAFWSCTRMNPGKHWVLAVRFKAYQQRVEHTTRPTGYGYRDTQTWHAWSVRFISGCVWSTHAFSMFVHKTCMIFVSYLPIYLWFCYYNTWYANDSSLFMSTNYNWIWTCLSRRGGVF